MENWSSEITYLLYSRAETKLLSGLKAHLIASLKAGNPKFISICIYLIP